MGIIGVQTPIYARSIRLTFDNPGTAVPDGQGGYTDGRAPVDPPLFGDVRPGGLGEVPRQTAAVRPHDLEMNAPSGTTESTVTYVIIVPFHPAISTHTRATWTDLAGQVHSADVSGVDNVRGLCRELVLTAVEAIP